MKAVGTAECAWKDSGGVPSFRAEYWVDEPLEGDADIARVTAEPVGCS